MIPTTTDDMMTDREERKMNNYKLVQLEPTPEMVEAAEDAYMPFGDMDLAIRMALLTAPAVQGEPVGWVWHSYNQTNFTSGSHHKEVLEADGVKLTPVYTAPQPAEQQPAPDVSALVGALEASTHRLHEQVDGEDDCRCGQCRFVRLRDAALAAHRKGGE